MRPLNDKESPIEMNQQPTEDEQEKLGVKQDVIGVQGTAPVMDRFPQIYSNWPPATAQHLLFPFQSEMYANGFSAFQPGIGYSQMFSDFQSAGAVNPPNISYYNPTNETPNSS
ncbi:hypothetical protein M3Y97_00002800 [Aphelenchoides bicaudatus]|nr:hypothetical protein M3Y97_00002800 [Aphelenchoides bicaudatus]